MVGGRSRNWDAKRSSGDDNFDDRKWRQSTDSIIASRASRCGSKDLRYQFTSPIPRVDERVVDRQPSSEIETPTMIRPCHSRITADQWAIARRSGKKKRGRSGRARSPCARSAERKDMRRTARSQGRVLGGFSARSVRRELCFSRHRREQAHLQDGPKVTLVHPHSWI